MANPAGTEDEIATCKLENRDLLDCELNGSPSGAEVDIAACVFENEDERNGTTFNGGMIFEDTAQLAHEHPVILGGEMEAVGMHLSQSLEEAKQAGQGSPVTL